MRLVEVSNTSAQLDAAIKQMASDHHEVTLEWPRTSGIIARRLGFRTPSEDWSSVGAPSTFLPWHKANTERFADAFAAYVAKIMTRFTKRHTRKRGTLLLYRVLSLPFDPVKAILAGKKHLGIYWAHSDDEKLSAEFSMPEPHAADAGLKVSRFPSRDFRITAEVPASSVDWFTTAVYVIELEDFEQEVRLLPGGPIFIKRITDVEKRVDLDITPIKATPVYA